MQEGRVIRLTPDAILLCRGLTVYPFPFHMGLKVGEAFSDSLVEIFPI